MKKLCVSLLALTVAVLVIVLGLWVSGSLYQTLALVNRRRKFIGPVVGRAGLRRSRRHFDRYAGKSA